MPVTSDLDIYRSARRLIKQHGDETTSMVIAMIRQFNDLEDPEAIAVWNGILKAVEELQAQEGAGGATVH